ncbi:acyltransferase family protein [Paraburkholderia silviterrae]|uniref:Acyltransferase n=1 Tax=Paraburkholderia silviterrae TaxID=2528715 RepID=A0A4R5M256_9BURK|nr:acyltransferase [Paraburkholderia silviterrae]TDG19191.1 acyltransferase [Paraburkholderia silviterrae]
MSQAVIGANADRMRGIEAMRGIAAMIVAYFHCRAIAWIGIRAFTAGRHHLFSLDTVLAYLSIPFVWGPIGVPIFFVISGYCIHRSQAMRLAHNPQYRLDARDFLWRRFVRIYPVLFCALLLTFALDSISLHFWPHNELLGNLGWRTFGANLFALQGIASPTYGSDTALWTLSLEIQFYVLYPLLFIVQRRLGPNRLLAVLMLLGAVSYALLERRGILIFTTYWSSWYLGAWFAEREVRGLQFPRWFVTVASPLLLVLGCMASTRYSRYLWCEPWALAFVPLLEVMLCSCASGTRAMRVLEKVGEFSYSLYIVHIPIAIVLVSWLFHSTRQVSILWSIGFFFVALVGAYVFHLLIERPAIGMLRKTSTQRRSAAGNVGAT